MTDRGLNDDLNRLIEEIEQNAQESRERMAPYLSDSGHLDPERVSSRDVIRAAAVSVGNSSFLREVAIPSVRQMQVGASTLQLEIVDYVPLPPVNPEGVRPRNSLTDLQYLLHVGIFIGEFTASATGSWAVGKVLDRVQGIATTAWRHNAAYWKGHSPHGFWFIVSIWNDSDKYWAVIAIETSSSLADKASSLTAAYHSITRSMSRKNNRRHTNQGDGLNKQSPAALITVQEGKASRMRVFPDIEDAVERLGSVPLVTAQGLLEALWIAKHPDSSLSRRVCQVLQENPNRSFRVSTLALMSSCSVTTVRATVNELALMQAPVFRLPDSRWEFKPEN